MQIAVDEKGIRTSVRRAVKGQHYFCPVCGSALVVRKGKIRIPHFAHKTGSECDWGDMSEWHLSWQERFPEDNREVIIEKDGVKHIADIFIPEANTVIEFQHSAISFDDFNARNQFYTNCGHKLVWVFDATNKIRPFDDRLEIGRMPFLYRQTHYATWELVWNRKHSAFQNYTKINAQRDISIILEVEAEPDNKTLYIVKELNEKFIDAYSFCEPISDLNLLRTYGVISNKSIPTLKQISEKTKKIIEAEKAKQKALDYQKTIRQIENIGFHKFFNRYSK